MAIKLKNPKCRQPSRYNKRTIDTVIVKPINPITLKEKGRVQYFYHSPFSELPIRDVSNEQNEGH